MHHLHLQSEHLALKAHHLVLQVLVAQLALLKAKLVCAGRHMTAAVLQRCILLQVYLGWQLMHVMA